MSALTSRLQGNTSVDKNVLYADRARFFPWRPRLFFAERNVIIYAGVAQAVLLAWALLSPMTAGTQPVVWCKSLILFYITPCYPQTLMRLSNIRCIIVKDLS